MRTMKFSSMNRKLNQKSSWLPSRGSHGDAGEAEGHNFCVFLISLSETMTHTTKASDQWKLKVKYIHSAAFHTYITQEGKKSIVVMADGIVWPVTNLNGFLEKVLQFERMQSPK